MDINMGQVAALGTALCWTVTSTCFSLASRRLGSAVVNRTRLLLAVIFLMATHWVMLASPIPLTAGLERWFWLALSGVVGLVIGDAFLFQAFVWVGPRLSMLMMSLAPVISLLFAWLFLGESVTPIQFTALLLTVGGIAWVVLDWNGRGGLPPGDRNYLLGILFGLGAATGQALGLIAAKKGLVGDFPALSANLMRMLAAATVIWLAAFLQGGVGLTVQRLQAERLATRQLFGGAIFGPFLGVWLSLIAIQLTEVGIASTIMALPPVFLLPVGYLLFKERIGWQAILGTILAIVGVAILFLI